MTVGSEFGRLALDAPVMTPARRQALARVVVAHWVPTPDGWRGWPRFRLFRWLP